MKKLEYKLYVAQSYLESETELQRLGTEGWELVSVVNLAGTLLFYLKK